MHFLDTDNELIKFTMDKLKEKIKELELKIVLLKQINKISEENNNILRTKYNVLKNLHKVTNDIK